MWCGCVVAFGNFYLINSEKEKNMKKTINSIALILLALTMMVSAFALSSCTDVQTAQGEPDAEADSEMPDSDVDAPDDTDLNVIKEVDENADEEITVEEETTAAPAPAPVPEEPVAPTAPSADPVVQEPEAYIDTSAPSQDLIDRIENDYDARRKKK